MDLLKEKIPPITISCQIRSNQPFSQDKHILRRIIDSAVLAGAQSLRINGSEYIKYVRNKYPNIFIFGIEKNIDKKSPSSGWVTPNITIAKNILKSNPDVIVLDGSIKLHTKKSLGSLITEIRKISNILVACDIGSEIEADRAIECGANLVLTTFVQAKTREGLAWNDHLNLVKKLRNKKIPFICEGGIIEEDQVKELLLLGAMSVVLGRVVIDPGFNTERFLKIPDGITKEKLSKLFYKHLKEHPFSFEELGPHGSSRKYFKISSRNNTILGTTGDNLKENETFIALGKHLAQKGVRVPQIIDSTKDKKYYIQEFCEEGDVFDLIKKSKEKDTENILHKAVRLLSELQTEGTKGWDFSRSYPFSSFNSDEVKRDFKRFKDRFLLNLKTKYSKKKLNKERDILIKEIESIPESEKVLMHRDFQTRNIVIKNNEYVLIDFQGARKGPMQYDLASLLYQSQMKYSNKLRMAIIEKYLSVNEKINKIDFLKRFYIISVIRLIQSIGSYGIAGLENKKDYFIKSIPYALDNLIDVLNTLKFKYNINLIELRNAITKSKNNFKKQNYDKYL